IRSSSTAIAINGHVNGTIRACSLIGSGTGTGVSLTPSISTIPYDTLAVEPTRVEGFDTGVHVLAGGTAQNILCVDNRINFGVDGNATANYCTSIGISRTDAGYYWDGYPGARVSNSIAYGGRYGVIGAIVSYSDMWAAGDNLGGASSLGPMVSSFDPYFG